MMAMMMGGGQGKEYQADDAEAESANNDIYNMYQRKLYHCLRFLSRDL